MPEMGNLNLDQAVRRGDSVELPHHRAKAGEVGSHMFEHVFEQNILKGIILKRPRGHFDIHQNIGLTLYEAIGVDEAFSTVKSASKVQFSHRWCSPSAQVALGRFPSGQVRLRHCQWGPPEGVPIDVQGPEAPRRPMLGNPKVP